MQLSAPSTIRRPSPRAAALLLSTLLGAATAGAVAITGPDHLRCAAVDEATRTTQSVVLGYMGTSLIAEALAEPGGSASSEVNQRLEQLAGAGQILRIKVWAPDGTVAFSDLPALRGRQFPLEGDLEEVFDGGTETEFSDGSAEENVFEHGLADRFLSIYLPIRAASGGIVGAYEVYEDAAPIDAAVDAVRRDVVLFVGAMALALLAIVYVAFAGSSRLLTGQNRRLREQALTEQLRATECSRPYSVNRLHPVIDHQVEFARACPVLVGAHVRAEGDLYACRHGLAKDLFMAGDDPAAQFRLVFFVLRYVDA